MRLREPIILGLTATQMAEVGKRAACQAVRSHLLAGNPVTGMVDGEIRTLYPTDPAALRLLQTNADDHSQSECS